MERLNYFNPYNTKESNHEDQLTRAYLVLLKHSFHVFSLFIDYCRTKHDPDFQKSEEPLSLAKLIESGWEIQTQKGNPLIDTDWLLSILITDVEDNIDASNIEKSERNAVYDGIITFGKNITFIIENKPRSWNIWFEQLNPSRENLSEDTKVYNQPIILEWKEIIKQLNLLLSLQTLSGFEKIMIEDFLAYIDQNFPHLNPFDNLSLCKGNQELIYRRISQILKSIVKNPEVIKYHRSWGYYIEVPYKQIREIGLILNIDGDKWILELSLYFGASQSQAKALYSESINLNLLTDTTWKVFSNFHISFRSSNLVWFRGCEPLNYINFWTNNVENIYQNKRNEVREYIDWLYENNILIKTPEVEDQLTNKFFNTAIPNLNMCPELGLIYPIIGELAENMDKKGKLAGFVKEKIIECLKVVNIDPSNIFIP
ncbi:MAG: hypothetical protein JW973_15425 [Bacteroidales bacterium]|nr:hypothetical protein [Bacteroidales bacterium]